MQKNLIGKKQERSSLFTTTTLGQQNIVDRWLLFRGHIGNNISNWDPRSPLFGTRKVVVVGRWLLFVGGSYSSGLTVILNLNRFDKKK
jgi:hypothetical protein